MADGTFLATESLFQIARVRASGTIPDEGRQSLPIPVRAGHMHVQFFFCPTQLSPREGLRLAPPNYLERIDVETGALIDLRAVKPAEFGQRHGADEPIGAIVLPPDLTPERYVDLRTRLFQLYDRLMPQFAAGATRPSDAMRDDAREFRLLFDRLREAPLAEYYAAVGADFFAWLEAMAR